MADWNPRTNGTLRGFLIIVAIAAGLTAAGTAGSITLALVFLILQIAFIVVIGIVLFGLWRRHREDIGMWPLRARVVFYGAATLALVNLVSSFFLRYPSGGLEAVAFFGVLAACAFAMWRVWQDQHTYGY
jgi:hypothetical protein